MQLFLAARVGVLLDQPSGCGEVVGLGDVDSNSEEQATLAPPHAVA